MAIFKCKMCGGTLEVGNESVLICEYCGTKQTLPKLNDERLANLYDRANHFRRNNEYDKAMGIYEKILMDDSTDAEAYWSLVLCRYGIEYVEDPTTHKRVPTVNRAQFTSVFDDDNYKSALKYADSLQKSLYEEEAQIINGIQKNILAISQKEEPFDVFICYKETDAGGRRTPDSVLANDLYHQLVQEGYKVFFSRITLEDKLGQEYEPYIFAALNTARVMVVLGTRPEHFNAVWVKNEWSRYLNLVKESNGRKMLIPAYKDMDPYDLPEEFSHLQAQDMSKLGFMQDLIRGIKKIAVKDEPKPVVVKETVVSSAAPATTAPLLRRAFMFLEDSDWQSANEYAEKGLDIEPECAEGYLVKLMAELKVQKKEKLKDCSVPFSNSGNYTKAVRFGSKELKEELEGYINHINERNKLKFLTNAYNESNSLKLKARTELEYKKAADSFEKIINFKDAKKQRDICLQEAENARKEAIYQAAKQSLSYGINLEKAIELFKSIPGWKDADELIEACEAKIRENKAAAEKRAKKNKKIIAIISPLIVVVVAFIIVLNAVIIPGNNYKKAVAFMDEGKYAEAIVAFTELGDYKDSAEKIKECNYILALGFEKEGKTAEAAIAFGKLGDYKDAKEKSFTLWNEIAVRETVSAGDHTVGLKSDGTVVATEHTGDYDVGQCDVEGWTDIVAVSAGNVHTIGLKYDGTVVAVGDNDVEGWTDIVAIAAGVWITVGLKSDGTVVAVGGNGYGECDVEDWTNIVAIAAGDFHTVGLKSDGTVVATEYTGDYYDGQCDVEDWTNIVAIAAGDSHTVGLKSDGTVVATEYIGDVDFYYGECDVEGWTDIVAVSAGYFHTVGLKSDGTVVAVGRNYEGQCNVGGWTDIVAVSAGGYHTVGLKSDGTVVAVGDNDDGQCNVDEWSGIRVDNDAVGSIKAQKEEKYNTAVSLMNEGKTAEAAIAFGKLGDYKDAKGKSFALWNEIAVRETVSASSYHTVGLKSDGTVVATEYTGDYYDGQCDVSSWSDIVAVSAGGLHTVGLKSDGTVVATEYTGALYEGQCDVSSWSDIVAVSAGDSHTVGLKSDGTVVAVGDNYDGQCYVSSWSDIVAVSAGGLHTVGLKSDGTVVATEYTGAYYYDGQCDVEGWTDIVAVSAGEYHTVGLKSDGTVVVVGDNEYGQCNVSDWTDIVAVLVGSSHTVGLKSDGTVVAVGKNDDGRCNVSGWTDIVAVSAGEYHTVGLKSDGTVVATEYTGHFYKGQCDIEGWKNIRLP